MASQLPTAKKIEIKDDKKKKTGTIELEATWSYSRVFIFN